MRVVRKPVAGLRIKGEAHWVPKKSGSKERPQSSCNFIKRVKALRDSRQKDEKKFAPEEQLRRKLICSSSVG